MAKKDVDIRVSVRSNRAQAALKRLKSGVAGLAKTFGVLAAAGTAVATVVGARLFAGAIRSAGEFDEQMSIVGAVTRATADEMANLRAAADEAGATTRFTATEAAQGLEELARSGQNANEAIATLNPVLNLAAGNNQTVAESAIQVTTALNAFGLAADQAGRVSDVYTRAAQRSAQTTAQLGEAMTFVAPVARQAGLEVETTAALIGKLADSGFRASLGGTALRNAILQFQDPASAFRGELEKLGIRTDDFVEALAGLSDAGDGAESAIRSLGLRAGPAIQAIVASGGPALRELTEELENAAGASEEAAAALEDNLPGALRGLNSAFDAARRQLAAPLVKAITEEVQGLSTRIRDFVSSGTAESLAQSLATAFSNAAESVRNFLSDVDFSAVTERLNTFVTTAGQRLADFSQSAIGFGQIFTRIAGGIQVFVGVLGTLFNSLGVVVAKSLELGTSAIDKFLGLIDFFSLGTIDAIQRVRDELDGFGASFAESTAQFEQAVGGSVDRLVRGWENLTVTFEDGADRAGAALDNVGQSIKTGVSEPSVEAQEQLLRIRMRLEEAGVSAEVLGSTVERTGAQIEESSERAAESTKKIGDAAEQTARQVGGLADVDVILDNIGAEADETSAQFRGMADSIAAAGSTTELDALAIQVNTLAQSGKLTKEEVERLVAALKKQAAAMDEAAVSTDSNTRAVRDLGSAASQTGGALDSMGNQARGASRGARNLVQDMGNAINVWRDAGPEATARVEDFVRQWNQIGLFTFEGARNRINRFVEGMEREFGTASEAVARYQESLRETDRDTGRLSDSTNRLGQSISGLGGAEVVQRIIVEFRRDQGEQVVLSESQMNRIADRVLEQIETDRERSG